MLRHPLPAITDRVRLNNLVGHEILYVFGGEHYGWYIGTITVTQLRVRDLTRTPCTNRVVAYHKTETMLASLHVKVESELSMHLYRVDQWWVLLKRKT